jgi:hypothetical protein
MNPEELRAKMDKANKLFKDVEEKYFNSLTPFEQCLYEAQRDVQEYMLAYGCITHEQIEQIGLDMIIKYKKEGKL